MEVIPAIDIRGGKYVRLRQGDYGRETVFGDDPTEAARRWVGEGATRLHIVDLDGARAGIRVNAAIVEEIVRVAGIPVQLGGGVRDADGARELRDLGVDRLIFGTAAIENPEEVQRAVEELGAQHVVVGVDARDGLIQTRGWTKSSGMPAIELFEQMNRRGVSRFLYTDTARDGTLAHPNFDALAAVLSKVSYPVIVAGGVTTIEDLHRLAEMGAEAAVTGLAIYSGSLDLGRAIREVQNADR